MKTYILILIAKENKEVLKNLEEILANEKENYRITDLKFQNFNIISFKTNEKIDSVKTRIMKSYTPSPLFFLIETTKNEKFVMNFEKLEPIINLEPAAVENLKKEKVILLDDNLGLDQLLDLVFKNGFSSLTEKQKDRLKELSES